MSFGKCKICKNETVNNSVYLEEHLNAKNQKEQLTAENDYLKEELESLATDYISLTVKLNEITRSYGYFYEHANKVLNDKNALIQEYAYNFKKQNNVIISLKQTCNYLLAELNKKNLATSETSNNLDKKTLRKVYSIGL